MAISFVAAGAVATGASMTVSVPTGYAANDVFFLLVTNNNNALATPSGWTLIATGANANYTYLFKKIATASESAVSIATNAAGKGVMIAYRGSSGTTQVSATFNGGVFAGTFTPATTTTTVANETVIYFYVTLLSNNSTLTANASTTQRVNSGNTTTLNGILIADEVQAVAGVTTARTATGSPSPSAYSAGTVGLVPATNSGNFFFMFN